MGQGQSVEAEPLNALEVSAALKFENAMGEWLLEKEAVLGRPLKKQELVKALEFAGVALDGTFEAVDEKTGKLRRVGINGMYEHAVACIDELSEFKGEAVDVAQWVQAVRKFRPMFLYADGNKLHNLRQQLDEGLTNTTPICDLPWASPAGRAGCV